MKIHIQAVPTHIITGFLGSGKTTLLQAWLATKPKDEVWAVLMNEFGQIGLDQLWIEEQGIAVKEVLGGCLCCTSQLPMQITLARLLSEYQPNRLFIEPTGLGHPQDLLKQLTEPHWHSTLSLREMVVVVDGSRLHERLWEQQDIFSQQIEAAQHVVISHCSKMTEEDKNQLEKLQQVFDVPNKIWHMAEQGQMSFSDLDHPYQLPQRIKQPLLTQQINRQADQNRNIADEPKTLPYHYVQRQGQYQVAGWHLPKSWQFDADQLLYLLQQLKGWERIKAKLHTNQGWLDINATITQFNVDFAAKSALDQRLEIIGQHQHDWQQFEQQLLNTRCVGHI